MRNLILIAGLALLALPIIHVEQASAYSSNVGADPKNDDPGLGNTGYGDLETKAIVKSATAGKSGAITPRRVLAYSSEADGYTVTRNVTRTIAGLKQLACVSMDNIATGDTGYYRCITKGFVRLKFDADTFPIEAGIHACVNSDGVVTGCSLGNEATINSGIIPLEAKVSGTGEYLKAMINLQ